MIWGFVRRWLRRSRPVPIDAVLQPEITRLLWQVQGTGEVPLSPLLGELTAETLLVNGFIERVGWHPVAPRYRVSRRGWYYIQHGRVPDE